MEGRVLRGLRLRCAAFRGLGSSLHLREGHLEDCAGEGALPVGHRCADRLRCEQAGSLSLHRGRGELQLGGMVDLQKRSHKYLQKNAYMANYSAIKATVNAYIKANGKKEITGHILNSVLNATIDSLGKEFQFGGVLTPADDPGQPDQNVAYIGAAGTYPNFDSLVIASGTIGIFMWKGNWSFATIPVGKDYDNDIQSLTHELQELYENIQELSDDVIHLDGINEEDLSIPDGGKLQFANRVYNAQQPDGMGYVILRKNKTFAEQVTEENTIYEVRDSFSLAGSFSMPSGCILYFNGGKIQGGTLLGNGTLIAGDCQFDAVTFGGTFDNEDILVDSKHFLGSVDFFGICRSFSKAEIVLGMDIVVTAKDVNLIPSLNLDANGHSIKIKCMAFSEGASVLVKNAKFDCSVAESTLLHMNGAEGGFLDLYGSGVEEIKIQNCIFSNIPGGFTFTYFRAVKNVDVSGCAFVGTFNSESPLGGRVLFFYNYYGKIVVENNSIKNCDGVAVAFLGAHDNTCKVSISGNRIESIGEGGIVANGGIIYNADIHDNSIIDTNLSGNSGSAQYANFNAHGFNNLRFYNNYVSTPNSGLDIDGSQSGEVGPARGTGADIFGNIFVSCKAVALWVVDSLTFRDNTLTISDNINIIGSNVVISNNIVKSTTTKKVFYISKRTGFTDHSVDILENIVTAPNTNLWLDTVQDPLGRTAIRGNVCRRNDTSPLVYMSRPMTYIVSLDENEHVLVKFNLSKEEIIPLWSRDSKRYQVLSARVFALSYVAFTTSVDIGLGVKPKAAAANNYGIGTITISSPINGASSDPIMLRKALSGRDFYLYCPGGGEDVEVYMDIEISSMHAIQYT